MPDRLTEIRARLEVAQDYRVEWPDHKPGTLAEFIAHASADIAWLLDELQQSYWDVDEAIRNGEDAADYWKQQFDSLRRQHKEMRP